MKWMLIACISALVAVPLVAQDTIMKFKVPSEFHVGDASLPAGSYEIRRIDPETYECTAASGSPSVMFAVDPVDTVGSKTDVSFAKYGDTLILKSVSIEGFEGFTVMTSLQEKAARKSGKKPTKVSAATVTKANM